MERISRPEMFAEIALVVSKRSTCPKKQVGAVLAKLGRVIAIGYNGVLPNQDSEQGYNPITGETKTVHAEANLIAFCAKNGISTDETALYITLSPCEKCAELIIQAGITHVIYVEKYRTMAGLNKLKKHNVITHQVDLCPQQTK